MVVVTEGNDPPGLIYIAPYAATSIAEYFMEQGRDVLIGTMTLRTTRAPTANCPCCCAGRRGAKPIPATFSTFTRGCWSAPRICAKNWAAAR